MIALFRQLILSITAAALFGAVMLTMTEQKSQRSVLQLAVGLLLLLAIINPLRHLKLPEIFSLPSGIAGNATQNQKRSRPRFDSRRKRIWKKSWKRLVWTPLCSWSFPEEKSWRFAVYPSRVGEDTRSHRNRK